MRGERARAPAPRRAPGADRRRVARSGHRRVLRGTRAAPRIRRCCCCATSVNLGFTGTANRGMQLSRADVVLLNSDTIVTRGWLDALLHCAATDPTIGTITPFSNNAEICSFPRFCEDNPWPDRARSRRRRCGDCRGGGADVSRPARPASASASSCAARCSTRSGIFDPAFGAGYGEENDLCLRAARAGWRNVLADNAFVVHTGGRSFAGQKAELGPRNMALLLERHPHYLDMVRAYIAADPLRPLREAAASRLAVDSAPGRGVLHVIHHHGGGTETHVRALIAGSRERWRHYLAIAVDDRWQVEEHRADGARRHVRIRCAASTNCGATSSAESARRSALRSSTCTTFPPAATESSRRSPICRCRSATRSTTSISRARRSRSWRRRNVLRRRDRRRRLHALPARAAGVRRRGHRDVARAPPASCCARAAFRIAPSRWAADMLERYFPECATVVVAHGMPDAVASARSRSHRAALRSARRRRADGRGAGRDRSGQGRAPPRAAGRRWRARAAPGCASC